MDNLLDFEPASENFVKLRLNLNITIWFWYQHAPQPKKKLKQPKKKFIDLWRRYVMQLPITICKQH